MYQRNISNTTLDTGNNDVPEEYQKHYQRNIRNITLDTRNNNVPEEYQ